MRLVLRLSAAAAALALAAAPAAAQVNSAKFGYINSRVVLEQSPAASAAQQRLEREMAPYRQQVQRMSDSLNTMIADYTKVQPTLAAPQREVREKAIRDKQGEFQQRTQKLQDDAQKREQAIVEPMMDQIRTVIEELRKSGGYAMIFDVAASNGSGFVVSADKSLDLTDQVVARVKTLRPGTAAAPAGPARGATAAPAGVTRPKTPSQ